MSNSVGHELAASAKPTFAVAPKAVHNLLVRGFAAAVAWAAVAVITPVEIRAEITFPDRHRDIIELKPIQGTQSLPISYPAGGTVGVRMISTDSTDKPAITESAVSLAACDK